MGCPIRPTRKSFFGFTYNSELPHDWKVWSIYTRPYNTWMLTDKCEFCGGRRTRMFVGDESIIRVIGFLPEVGILGIIYSAEINEQARAKDGNKD